MKGSVVEFVEVTMGVNGKRGRGEAGEESDWWRQVFIISEGVGRMV